jgi:hypothetical protein
MSIAAQETPYRKVALAFATALVSGDFEAAARLLATSMRESLTAATLQAAYESMTGYFQTPPTFINVEEVLTDWPDKQMQDIGWAYVSISDDRSCEAVAVIVCQEADKYSIRSIAWGRP